MEFEEKVKEGLKACANHEDCANCPYEPEKECARNLNADALDRIRQLEAIHVFTLEELHTIAGKACDYKRYEGDGAGYIKRCAHPKNSECFEWGDCNAEKCPLLTNYKGAVDVK